MRRFFQDRGHWWTTSRKTTAWKWSLVVLTGVVIAITGVLVQWFTDAMTDWKFDSCNDLIDKNGNQMLASDIRTVPYIFISLCRSYKYTYIHTYVHT